MLMSVVYLQTFHNPTNTIRIKCFVQTCQFMRVQVVHHQHHSIRVRVHFLHQPTHHFSEVFGRPSVPPCAARWSGFRKSPPTPATGGRKGSCDPGRCWPRRPGRLSLSRSSATPHSGDCSQRGKRPAAPGNYGPRPACRGTFLSATRWQRFTTATSATCRSGTAPPDWSSPTRFTTANTSGCTPTWASGLPASSNRAGCW